VESPAGVLFLQSGYGFRKSSGSLAMFAAIRRASLRAWRKLASSLARPICDLDFSRRPQPFCHDKTEPPG
jgi:hypothetical protein